MTRISSNRVNVLEFVCECPLRAIAAANLASVVLLTVVLAVRRQHLDLLAVEAAFLQAWHQPHRLATVSWLRHLPRAMRFSRALLSCGQAVIDVTLLAASIAIARLMWLHSHRLLSSSQRRFQRFEPLVDFPRHDAGLAGEPVPRFSRGAAPDRFTIGEPRREDRQLTRWSSCPRAGGTEQSSGEKPATDHEFIQCSQNVSVANLNAIVAFLCGEQCRSIR